MLHCVSVYMMASPEQLYEGVQETSSVTPAPSLHEALPRAPENVPVYVVETLGEVDVDPEVGTVPSVEMTPLVTPVLVHDSNELSP